MSSSSSPQRQAAPEPPTRLEPRTLANLTTSAPLGDHEEPLGLSRGHLALPRLDLLYRLVRLVLPTAVAELST